MDDLLGLGLAFVGLAAYGKYMQAEAERERAINALRDRALELQDAVQNMEIDLIADADKYSAKQMRAARHRADRALDALLLAEAGLHRP